MTTQNSLQFDLKTMTPDLGHTTIQASAGTGKTFSIAGLVAKFIIQGVRLPNILLVTFGNAATAELKDRVRDRLRNTIEYLQERNDQSGMVDKTAEVADPVHSYLEGLGNQERLAALQSVRQALHEFDEGHISTIHSFSSQSLRQIGQLNPLGANYEVISDLSGLCTSAVHDAMYLMTRQAREYGLSEEDLREGFARVNVKDTVSLVTTLIQRPDMVVTIFDKDAESAEAASIDANDITTLKQLIVEESESNSPLRHAAVCMLIVMHAVELTRTQLQRSNLVSHDMQVTALRDVLRDHPVVVDQLRAQFSHVLIDEFQDTDEVQWEVFHRAFLDTELNPTPSTVVTVGDPKQAIYAFRGSDIQTYLEAIRGLELSGRLWTLSRNFRSTPEFIDAMNALWEPIELGSGVAGDAITYANITPGVPDLDRGVYIDNRRLRPLIFRTIEPATSNGNKKPSVGAGDLNRRATQELPHLVKSLLEGQVVESDHVMRPVRPDDIVIVTRSRREVPEAFQVLQRHNIPAVMVGGSSVLDATMARHFKWFLAAVALPHNIARAKAAALTFFGPENIDIANDDQVAAFQSDLIRWNQTMTNAGVMAFAGQLQADVKLNARLISLADGERLITDFEHLCELLAEATGFRGIEALKAYKIYQDLKSDLEQAEEVSERRADTSESAVRIMTVHKSKGLEFGIVICLGMNSTRPAVNRIGFKWLDDMTNTRRITDRNLAAPVPRDLIEELKDRDVEEAVRHVYVAFTRAKYATITWATHDSTQLAGNRLGRVLAQSRDSGGFKATETLPLAPRTDTVVQSIVTLDDKSTFIDLKALTSSQPIPDVQPVHDDSKEDLVAGSREHGEDPGTLVSAPLPMRNQRGLGRWSFSSWSTYRPHPQFHVQRAPSVVVVDDDDLVGGLDEVIDDLQNELQPASSEPSGEHVDPRASDQQGLTATASTTPNVLLEGHGAGAEFGTLIHSVLEVVDFQHKDLTQHLESSLGEQQRFRSIIANQAAIAEDLATAIRCPLPHEMGIANLTHLSRTDRIDELEFEISLAEHDTLDLQGVGALLSETLSGDDPYLTWAKQLANTGSRTAVTGALTGFIDLVYRSHQPDGTTTFHVVDYKTNWLHLGSDHPETHYGADALISAMTHADYPLQAILYNVALHRFLRWRLPGYDPSKHLGPTGYFFLRGMFGGGYGVAIWHPSHRAIEALSNYLHSPQHQRTGNRTEKGVSA